MTTVQRPRPGGPNPQTAAIAKELQLAYGPLLGEMTVQAVVTRHAATGADPHDLLEDCRAKLAEILANS